MGGKGRAELYELKTLGLEARFFGGTALKLDAERSNKTSSDQLTSDLHLSTDSQELQLYVGDPMFQEDGFLTSANLCRWIINFSEIEIEKQIGLHPFSFSTSVLPLCSDT